MNDLQLNKFLSAISGKKPKIKTVSPKGVELQNAPFVYTDISAAELANSFCLASIALHSTNERENVLVKAENTIVLMLSNDKQIKELNNFSLFPSAILSVGFRRFAIWFIEKDADIQIIQQIQEDLSKFIKRRNLVENWLPIPTFQLIEADENGNNIFTDVEIVHFDERIYKLSEIKDLAFNKKSAVLESGQIQSAILEHVQNESAISSKTQSKSAISKGERTYQNFLQLIGWEMTKSAILETAFSELGLKSRRVADLLKSAVLRGDIVQIRHGVYAPKGAFSTDLGLPLAK